MSDHATAGNSPSVGTTGTSPLLVSIAVMLATIMVILDMTVVNVNLADMMGALGASADQITWVLTSYIVAEAITIPLGATLAKRLGRKRLMIGSVAGFVLTSAACGQANSLSAMVLFRLLQGVFGASIIPVSQAVMVDTFPPQLRGRAMAIWGIGIMLGPILGPTLGGYISQHLDWRWVFYINVPVGLLNLVLLGAFMHETAREKARADWIGALLLAVGVGSLQAALDQGNQKDWFQSGMIQLLFLLAVVGLGAFVVRSANRDDAILKIKLLRDRNLATSSFMMMSFGLGLFGTIALQPLMLGRLFDYPPETVGLIMAPRGIAAALGMFSVAGLINRIDARLLVAAGIVLSAVGSYFLGGLNLDADGFHVIAPSLLQGMGMGMIFVPLSTLAFGTLAKKDTDFGSGIFNLSRTIGSSIGISVASTVLTHDTSLARAGLVTQLVPTNPTFQAWMSAHGFVHLTEAALLQLSLELSRQSAMLGYVHAFVFIAASFVFLLPLVLFLKKGSGGGMADALH